MDIKRLLTSVVGFPVVVMILVFGNVYVLDVFFTIIAGLCMHEYLKIFKEKANPIKWIAYLSILSIPFLHVIPNFNFSYIGYMIPVFVMILFSQSVFSGMKYDIKDIAITLFGICYITLCSMSISLLSAGDNGKILFWYLIIAAWGTDIFAYITGCTLHLGKHKISKISPKKSAEGCIGGIIGAVLLTIIYTFFCNRFLGMNFDYLLYGCSAIIFSIIGQIGDFAASSIKRYAGVKDFSNLIPGHGGMLDRVDSVIFIAPIAYLLYIVIL